MSTFPCDNAELDGNGNGHSKASLMIVDDDPICLWRTLEFLQTSHSNAFEIVCTARDGEECLKQAQIFMPQIVLIDLNMPMMNGLQTIPLLRLLFPETCIIALAHEDGIDTLQSVLHIGGDGLVSKTYMRTDLVPAIERVMSRVE